jgi:hypothetical protein
MRAPLILGALALPLAAYLILVDRHRPGPAERRANRVRLLPDFARERVQTLTITRPGTPPLTLRRSVAPDTGAAEWRRDLGDPVVDQAGVDALLAELDFAERDRTVDLAPTAAGLAPPAVTLDAALGDRRTRLALGRLDASGRGVFALLDLESAVVVAPRRLLDLANRLPAALDPKAEDAGRLPEASAD